MQVRTLNFGVTYTGKYKREAREVTTIFCVPVILKLGILAFLKEEYHLGSMPEAFSPLV